MRHKNDYSVVVFFPSGSPKKWKFVHTLNSLAKFLHQNYPTWKYFNVYDRRTGQYLKRFYNGNIIPAFLTLLIFWGLAVIGSQFFPARPLNSTFSNLGRNFRADLLTFNITCPSLGRYPGTFINGFNNTATIWTAALRKGGRV